MNFSGMPLFTLDRERLHKGLSWLLDRLQERSTWGAILTVGASQIGKALDPNYADQIATVGMLVAGFVAFITKEQ